MPLPSPLSRRRVVRVASALLALGALTACATDSPSAVADLSPASIALRASVARANGVSQVRIAASYLRADGSIVAIGVPQLTTLGNASQQVPVAIDVATCLADAQRAGTAGNPPAADECNVVLDLEYLLDGVRVDQQRISGLSVKPGQTATVPQPVALAQVSDVRFVLPPANVQGQGLRLTRTGQMKLDVQVIDANGALITGRTVTWRSSNPAVATVSTDGRVAGVSVGTTDISADVAGRQVSILTTVVPPTQAITVASAGTTGRGTVQSIPAGLDCTIAGAQSSGTCTATFPDNANVQLIAVVGSNSEFVAFAGDCTNVQGTACAVGAGAARNVTVSFRGRQPLSVTLAGTGAGSVKSATSVIDCAGQGASAQGSCSVVLNEGTQVALTATAAAGTAFMGWTGDCAGSGQTCTVDMTASRAVTARFDRFEVITVAPTGSGGGGSVMSQPAGIDCLIGANSVGGTCAMPFSPLTPVTLTATPDAVSDFVGWSGACSGTGTCRVTPTQASTVTPIFRARRLSLTVSLSGPDGTVFVTPGTPCIANGAPISCTYTADVGTTFDLVAQSGTVADFSSFSGACSGTSTCAVSMNGDKVVTAAFQRRRVSFTTIVTGSGGGTVTDPAGSTCTLTAGQGTQTCTRQVDAGIPLALSTTPAPFSQLVSWGGACSGSGACVVTPIGPTTVFAVINKQSSTVTISRASGPGGTGVVVWGSPLSRCAITATGTSGACTTTLPPGASITFRIDPSVGFPFVGWGGACASFGTATTCTITPPGGPIDVTARFQNSP